MLMKHLSDVLSEDQKNNKIGNLLTKMRLSGLIYNAGSKSNPSWKLTEKTKEELKEIAQKEKERKSKGKVR